MLDDKVTLTIDIHVNKATATALKRLYEAQAAIPAISKHQKPIGDITEAMVDGVLIDIRISAKESIKQAIIAWEEP